MMSKKTARLYQRMQHGIQNKTDEAENLARKAVLAAEKEASEGSEATVASTSTTTRTTKGAKVKAVPKKLTATSDSVVTIPQVETNGKKTKKKA